MNYRFVLRLALLFAYTQPLCSETAITIDVARPAAAVSPHLYGIFLEEINHAVDGGIYAELIRNRAFNEDGASPAHWSAFGGAAISLDSAQHYGRMNRSLRMRFAGAARSGVSNGGFWGMKITHGKTYVATVWAKSADGFAGPLTLALESASGHVLGQTTIDTLTSEWRRYVRLMTVNNPAGSSAANVLTISAAAPGTVWLQFVSLFPPTWKGRTNGLRTDLADALAALQPRTMRFPGGSFVQGWNLTDSPWRWKTTIGELTDRRARPGLWGYVSSEGMGYHEYLQMAEDMGVEPVLCVWAGKTTGRDVIAQKDFDAVVQEALEAVEYANGDPLTTKWGAERARNGHYPPFRLRYIEFGNEDGYEDPLKTYTTYRFPMFLSAMRSRYPDIRVISSFGPMPSTMLPDLIDDHLYTSTAGLLESSRTYDARDRNGPRYFIGEYAANDLSNVNEPQRKNTLGGAIGEAGYMTGLERNSDLVWSAMYAPLLVNDADHRWAPNLIWFNADGIVLTPSYHVQKMFSTQIGDRILRVTLADAAGLYASATLAEADRAVFLKVANNNTAPRTATVVLDGAAGVAPAAAETVLTSANRSDRNTFSDPQAVAPRTTVRSDIGPRFTHTFPANSITVIRLDEVVTGDAPRPASATIQAETFDGGEAVTVEPAAEGELVISAAAVTYNSLAFGSYAVAMQARVQTDADNALEIRLDSADAAPVGACALSRSAQWVTVSCPLNGISGVHDLHLRFTRPLRLDWIRFLSAPEFTAAGVTNAASFRRGIVPGSIATIFGSGLSPVTGIRGTGSSLPRELAGASVTVDGIPAPLFAVANVNGAEQINLQVPWEIAGRATVQIVVTNGGVAGKPVQVDVWPAQPGVFTSDGFTAAALHGDTYAPVTAANPARRGETVLIYASGLGAVTDPPATGALAEAARTVAIPEVAIGGSAAAVSYSGLAPGFAGLYQLNVVVPADAPGGMAPLTIRTAGAVSELVGLPVHQAGPLSQTGLASHCLRPASPPDRLAGLIVTELHVVARRARPDGRMHFAQQSANSRFTRSLRSRGADPHALLPVAQTEWNPLWQAGQRAAARSGYRRGAAEVERLNGKAIRFGR